MLAIRTDQLSKTYGSFSRRAEKSAVEGLSLSIEQGEVFGLLGPNGAGKTTTIHLLLNLILPTSGEAYIFDRPATDTAVHGRLGYLPESVNLHTYYRGRALLAFYADLCGVPRDQRDARIDEVLRLVELEGAADKQVSKYSKGMAQRIGVAQALLHDPDLLILDEPTASLDPVGRNQFRELLLTLKRKGKTILLSSHILSEVEAVCDRVAILQNGKLKGMGTLAELSGSGTWRIVVESLPAAAIEALAATNSEITMAQGQVTVRCRDDVALEAVESILARHGAVILARDRERQSLDDIFLSTVTREHA